MTTAKNKHLICLNIKLKHINTLLSITSEILKAINKADAQSLGALLGRRHIIMQEIDRLDDDIKAFTSDFALAQKDARDICACADGRAYENNISYMDKRIKSSLVRLIELDQICKDSFKRLETGNKQLNNLR